MKVYVVTEWQDDTFAYNSRHKTLVGVYKTIRAADKVVEDLNKISNSTSASWTETELH